MNVTCPGDAQICDLRNGSANVLPLFNQSLVHKKKKKTEVGCNLAVGEQN